MSGAILPFPQCAFMAWCSVKAPRQLFLYLHIEIFNSLVPYMTGRETWWPRALTGGSKGRPCVLTKTSCSWFILNLGKCKIFPLAVKHDFTVTAMWATRTAGCRILNIHMSSKLKQFWYWGRHSIKRVEHTFILRCETYNCLHDFYSHCFSVL